ncbi:MAG: GGDEF domain-containing protein [Eubacterium sp.]|nr:GGDEF domain-containing protein [Eubacterium sp.]
MIKQFREMMMKRPLESRVFMIVLAVGTLISLLSAIFTIFENIGTGATLSTLICVVLLLLIIVLAFVFKHEEICHVLLCLILNLVLLPVAFFFCGGIKSGMLFYYFTSLYIVIPTIPKRITRMIVYLISATALLASIEIAYHWLPDWVAPMTGTAWHLDVIVSFILNAFGMYLIASLTVEAYQNEHNRNEQLVAQLEQLAVHDELTGLYNRRELFRVLEEDVMRASADDLHCLFIFDVDDFKKANDTYGHVFGDKVLREVARCLGDSMRGIDDGEIAARYGGEEFVCVFHDEDFDTSYARAEKIRQEVEKLRFYDNPDFRVTISGGVDRCNGMRPRYALRQVDDLLYLAKSTGKNQITRKV